MFLESYTFCSSMHNLLNSDKPNLAIKVKL